MSLTTLHVDLIWKSDLSSDYRFVLPDLRVGTLDSLMVLSDDLVKVNGLVESVVNKVRRQLFEMGAVNGSDTQEVCTMPYQPSVSTAAKDRPLLVPVLPRLFV